MYFTSILDQTIDDSILDLGIFFVIEAYIQNKKNEKSKWKIFLYNQTRIWKGQTREKERVQTRFKI